MNAEFETVFKRLRSILKKHAGDLVVTEDTATRYCLEGPVGPATLRAWGGRMKRERMPVTWVQIGKAYVSLHHMGLYGNSPLRDGMSPGLSQRMQGKTCFNFRSESEVPFPEIEALVARGCAGFKTAGFIR